MQAVYHLPGLFEFYELYQKFLPLFRGHRDWFYDWCDIGSVYGAPAGCRWDGGRAGFGEADPVEAAALTREYGVSARLTFSNSLLREEDLPVILEQYDLLAKEYIKRKKEGRGFTFFHFMLDLSQGPCVAKRLAGCGSGTEYLSVTPNGDIYPCHQFAGLEDFKLGNVDEGIVNTAVRDEFKLCNVYAKEKCRDCYARFYCSGGCAANSYNFHGTITDAYDIGCAMQKKRIECAIMMKAALGDMAENDGYAPRS